MAVIFELPQHLTSHCTVESYWICSLSLYASRYIVCHMVKLYLYDKRIIEKADV